MYKHVLVIHQVVSSVTKIVNFIRTRELNHRQFISLLYEAEAETKMFTAILMSSRNVLKRVWDLREEIVFRKEGKDKHIHRILRSCPFSLTTWTTWTKSIFKCSCSWFIFCYARFWTETGISFQPKWRKYIFNTFIPWTHWHWCLWVWTRPGFANDIQ